MLALIPARGGSKALPGKNIRPLCGKPLISYTIEAAQKSRLISRIVVSTDSQDIAEISRSLGAEVPFLRSVELATDTAQAVDVYIDTCERLYGLKGAGLKHFVVLLPTAPLRMSEDIDGAINLFDSKEADAVISVVDSPHPIQWHRRIDGNDVLRPYFDPLMEDMANRQSLPKSYLPNGSIFVLNYSFIKRNRSYYSNKTFAYIMPSERSVDIDSLTDFLFAEFLMEQVIHHEA